MTDCYKTAGGVACNQRAPNNFDAINQLVGVLQSIKDDAAKKQAAEEEAERLAAESARRDELVAIERQNAETERSRVESIAQQQSNAQQEREAARQAEQELRTQVSTAVLEGRCEDAKTIALLASRIDMAEQAMRLCKPKVPAKKSKSSKARADSGHSTKLPVAQSGSVGAPQAGASQKGSLTQKKLEVIVLKTVTVQQNGDPNSGISLRRSTSAPTSAKVDAGKFQPENLPEPPQGEDHKGARDLGQDHSLEVDLQPTLKEQSAQKLNKQEGASLSGTQQDIRDAQDTVPHPDASQPNKSLNDTQSRGVYGIKNKEVPLNITSDVDGVIIVMNYYGISPWLGKVDFANPSENFKCSTPCRIFVPKGHAFRLKVIGFPAGYTLEDYTPPTPEWKETWWCQGGLLCPMTIQPNPLNLRLKKIRQ